MTPFNEVPMTREEQLSLPALGCDFNACGWSGLPDDNCYYAMDRKTLDKLIRDGRLLAFGYMEDSETEFTGVAIQLERYGDDWRARPASADFVYGNLTELTFP